MDRISQATRDSPPILLSCICPHNPFITSHSLSPARRVEAGRGATRESRRRSKASRRSEASRGETARSTGESRNRGTTSAGETRGARELGRELRRGSGTNAGSRSSQARGRSSATGRSGDSGAGCECCGKAAGRGLAQARAGILRGRRLDGKRDDLGAADNGQAQCALLLCLDRLCLRGRATDGGGLGGLALEFAELFGVGENQVHVLVESQHLASHLATVQESDSHPVVDLRHKSVYIGVAIARRDRAESSRW